MNTFSGKAMRLVSILALGVCLTVCLLAFGGDVHAAPGTGLRANAANCPDRLDVINMHYTTVLQKTVTDPAGVCALYDAMDALPPARHISHWMGIGPVVLDVVRLRFFVAGQQIKEVELPFYMFDGGFQFGADDRREITEPFLSQLAATIHEPEDKLTDPRKYR